MYYSPIKNAILVFSLLFLAAEAHAAPAEQVVLLHGLARTSRSMCALERYLSAQGYQVLNIDYPSRKYLVSELAEIVRNEVVRKTAGARRVHFITHSLGGIVLRFMQETAPLPSLGRVVMLSPPNHGSEVVDAIGELCIFAWINGPAGRQLRTGPDGIAGSMGGVNFELGVITGDRSINWINSLIIPGEDDGKVSTQSARLEGMADFLIVHASHPFIMRDRTVMAQCLHFLRHGYFAGGMKEKGFHGHPGGVP